MKMVRDGVCALLFVALLSSCDDKSKPDFEAEAERLKAYVMNEAPKSANKLEADFDGKVRLLGYEVSPSKPVKPGQRVTLTLYWQSNKPVEAGYRLFTHVLDASGERIESLDDEGPLRELRDGRPALPPEAWKPGKVYVDELRFKVPKGVKTETIEVVAGIARKDERLNVIAGAKDGAGAAKVVTLEVGAAPRSGRERDTNVKVPKLAAKQKITIDGKLDEEIWKGATALKFGNPKAAKGTVVAKLSGDVRLLWSDTGFYAGFDVVDTDVTKEGTVGDKPEIRLDSFDAVEMLIDPERADNKDYYNIQIGPSNKVYDTRFDSFKEPGRPKGKPVPEAAWGHEDWASHLKSAVVVRGTLGKAGEEGEDKDEGYVVEVFVPWKSLSPTGERSAPKAGDTWRMNFHALENEGIVTWAPVNGLSFHTVQQFGQVTWSDSVAEPPAPPASAAPSGAPAKAAPASSAAKPAPALKPVPAAPAPAKPAAAPAVSK